MIYIINERESDRLGNNLIICCQLSCNVAGDVGGPQISAADVPRFSGRLTREFAWC
jgi:hypothetical protein